MSSQRKATLHTGATIPLLGLGTWRSDEGEAKRAVKLALEAGYRHLDCAYIYQNEQEIGEGIKESGIPREEIFVNTKLWNAYQHPDHVEAALDQSLKLLQLDYVDSYLIHWPYPQPYVPFYETDGTGEANGDLKKISGSEDFKLESLREMAFDRDGNELKATGFTLSETWRVMESLVAKGKVRHIGLSNFAIKHIKQILSECKIRPAILQVELHPYLPQYELVDFCHKEGIHVTAYAPLGSYGVPRLLEDSTLLAISQRVNATPAQILLAWAQQRNISVVPKSTNPNRIRENYQDITLSDEDHRLLSQLPISKRFFDAYPVFDD